MIEIPGSPRIQLYESLAELKEKTGYSGLGYFDARSDLIVATPESVAHEIGHFMDFRSGRMKVLAEIPDPVLKVEAKLRNEIVAILFARTKTDSSLHFAPYEVEFLAWFEFQRDKKLVSVHLQNESREWKLSEIQDFADFAVRSNHPWHGNLLQIFRDYLDHEDVPHLQIPESQSVRA